LLPDPLYFEFKQLISGSWQDMKVRSRQEQLVVS